VEWVEQKVSQPDSVAVGDDPDAVDGVPADGASAFDRGERLATGGHRPRVGPQVAHDLPSAFEVEEEVGVAGFPRPENQSR